MYLILNALALSNTISAQEYHVANTSNDKNNGTLNSPFPTIKVWDK